ncbi:unnamed protein product [Dracunculus medinensis]|uniref:MFS domain-containing protein n=1 Tax=Dracunculus medinensis TaxID=318479 RepID=A0A0N4UMS9_DRAME|nr:unnamed protein product [Dracunculus medinensis]
MFDESSKHPWVVAGLAYTGKFGIAASFAVIYIFAGELYPTVVRAIGMGMSSMVAGLGLILAPHVVRLGDTLKILPLIIMGMASVSAGFTSLLLPETYGASLPQTLQQAEDFGKNERIFFAGRRRRGHSTATVPHSRRSSDEKGETKEMCALIGNDETDVNSVHI